MPSTDRGNLEVVLCCWNQPCEQPFIAQFKSGGGGTWPFRHQVDIRGGSTIAIRSFHPAAAVCYDESRKACCRMLLICHFTLAFAELAGSAAVPEWVETVSRASDLGHALGQTPISGNGLIHSPRYLVDEWYLQSGHLPP
jgi:hypothetical protein